MPADLQRVRDLFLHAVGKLPAEQWDDYVAEACGGDAELRRQVGHLLQVHLEAGSYLERPAVEPVGTGAYTPADAEKLAVEEKIEAREAPGTAIGPYKLLQQIGEGGMGTVWMAEQTRPVQRKVAMKLIKAGMGSRQVIARFEAERQALALMDHPNIAKVLDAGTTDSGRPYFVMELVKGVPITRYCDEHHLTPKERLALFVSVCQAVQHAHQKGIIHRDLKPSNVMVCLYDDKPVPKVIDFGVAKAAGPKLTERTLFTEFGSVVGTLEYMSPEQAKLNQLDIDTRSDIYSLGVLLYELLTGTTPLERKRFAEVAFLEVLRLIREEEPPRPSTRLSTTEGLPSIAANRGLEPKKLSGLVRGELDWIVMKCLEKDRNRRYETPNGLAVDIQHYLHDEAVLACPPSASYRFRKFARRNKGPVLAAGLVFVALVVGIIGTTWGFLQAREERNRAVQAEDQAKANEAKAHDEEQKAKRSAAEARAVLQFFQDRVLASARPKDEEGGLGRQTTIREAVDAAEPGIEKAFTGQPAVEGFIRYTLANTYFYLGETGLAVRQHERGLPLLRQGLGPDHPDTLFSMNDLANAYSRAGRLADALPLYEETLRRMKAALGPDHAETLMLMNNVAWAYQATGRLAEALPLFEETLKLRKASQGPDHPHTLLTKGNLAKAYQEAGRLDEALPLFEETRKGMNAGLGPDHPHTLIAMRLLASGYQAAGRLAEAVPLFEETLRRRKAQLGPTTPTRSNRSTTSPRLTKTAGISPRPSRSWPRPWPEGKRISATIPWTRPRRWACSVSIT